MKVLREIIGKRVELGGKDHTGWLPFNSAMPRRAAIEIAIVDVRILEEKDCGFILEWVSHNTAYSNDSWHATIEEAQNHAKDRFGIEVSEWKSLGGDV